MGQSKKNIQKFTAFFEKKKFTRHQQVYKINEYADYIFLVKEGEFELSRPLFKEKVDP